ncbi:MAG: hypothetical protein RLZZ524_1761 [Pseudomonadota bacterium]
MNNPAGEGGAPAPPVEPATRDIIYYPGPIARQFITDVGNLFVGIRGPVGSGKSTAAVMKIVHHAQRQKPQRDGWRRTKWAIVRQTYPRLLSTTIPAFTDWFGPRNLSISKAQIITGMLRLPGKVQVELLFMSLDGPDAIDKLKSLQVTGIWFNEVSEITDRNIIMMALDRVGRWPRIQDGGPTWHGVIADTNPPADDHWWYQCAEILRPKGWRFYAQPGGLMKVGEFWVPNPRAENIEWLPGGYDYYLRKLVLDPNNPEASSEAYIRVFYGGEYGRVLSGRPCYPSFSETAHVATSPLEAYTGLPLILGWDFGRTPAVTMSQYLPNRQRRVLREIVVDPDGIGMGIKDFCRDQVRPYLEREFREFQIVSYCDPAGAHPGQFDDRTLADVAAEQGFPMTPAPSNDPDVRIADVEFFLRERIEGGHLALVLDPRLSWLRRAMAGGYHFKRLQVSGETRFMDVPAKNKFSHVADADQYATGGIRHLNITPSPRAMARPVEPAPFRRV